MESDQKIRFNIKTWNIDRWHNPLFELVQNTANFYSEGIAQCIKCPYQYLGNQKNGSFPGQTKKVYNVLTCSKKNSIYS